MIEAVLAGFYTQLATYHVTNKAYNIIAPQNASVPYVTFGLETDTPMGEFQNLEAMEDLTFWVNCFGASQQGARTIADLVLRVMDNSDLTVTGYTSLVCKREFIGAPIYDLDTKIFMVPCRYRVLLSKD